MRRHETKSTFAHSLSVEDREKLFRRTSIFRQQRRARSGGAQGRLPRRSKAWGQVGGREAWLRASKAEFSMRASVAQYRLRMNQLVGTQQRDVVIWPLMDDLAIF